MAAQQLHASFPKSFFPGFFPNTWQLPDLLSSAPIPKRLLLLLYTHTHSLAHPSQGKGREVAWLSILFSFLLVLPGSTGEFYFQFSNSIFSTFLNKTYCHLHISFPCVFHLLVRKVLPMLLGSSSSVAVFLYQRGQCQNFSPSLWLLSLQGFHSCCAAHWGFEPAHSQVACYNWCEK